MIGIDLIEVNRIKKIIKFLDKLFFEDEIKYFEKNHYNNQTIAGHFCAKEAIMKCFDCCKSITFKDIEIYHDENGKPFAKLYNIAEKEFIEKKYKKINISISHEKNYACAVAELN